MSQLRPSYGSIHDGWPRVVCPTVDDADGLRFLYPECEELLDCESLGGTELPPVVNATQIGCNRFTPANGHYSIDLYYVPQVDANWTNVTWSPLPNGRALPKAVPCVRPFHTEMGRTGYYRFFRLYYHAMLPPIMLLVGTKLLCYWCLLMPWMTRTRKRNDKLQRTAQKRKAEVRRMTEGGQGFAVKRAAKVTGQGEAAGNVIEQIKSSATTDGVQEKRNEVGNKLLNKMRPGGANRVSPEGAYATDAAPAADGAGALPPEDGPLQLTHRAPASAATADAEDAQPVAARRVSEM